MKEFKGTEGQWKHRQVSTHNGDFFKVIANEDLAICNVTTRNSELARANAQLIASAPEMLEALQNLENDNNQIPPHAWNMVQNAINKALGK